VEATSKPMQRKLRAAIVVDLLSFHTALQATLIGGAFQCIDVALPSVVKLAQI